MSRHETVFNPSYAFEKAQADFALFDILKEQLQAVGLGDEESLISAVESETSIKELYEKMLVQEGEVEAHIEILAGLIKKYSERKQRLDRKKTMLRTLILLTLNQTGLKSIPSAFGTASRSLKARRIEITDRKSIPTDFWEFPDPITPPAVLKLEELTKCALEIYQEREKLITEARLPFAEQIAVAKALPTEGERMVALEAIDVLLAPAMAAIDSDVPMPDGVRVADEEYKLTIRRA